MSRNPPPQSVAKEEPQSEEESDASEGEESSDDDMPLNKRKVSHIRSYTRSHIHVTHVVTDAVTYNIVTYRPLKRKASLMYNLRHFTRTINTLALTRYFDFL